MDSGLPLLNCLWQQTLQSLCSPNSSSSCKWIYAIFWRILPRNFPPPSWDDIGLNPDRSSSSKRNWILVWEDGFCDLYECEEQRFMPEIFFKMSHEVYNFGEGVIGKVAAENSHKWVYKDSQSKSDPNIFSSWNASIDPQPRAWEFQFNSGIQTIAVIAVSEGVIQLGSLHKVAEDLDLVMKIRRKFYYFRSMPGALSLQRPAQAPSDHCNMENIEMFTCGIRLVCEKEEESNATSIDTNTWNKEQNQSIMNPILPPISSSLEMLLARLPSVTTTSYVHAQTSMNSHSYSELQISPYSSQSGEETGIVHAEAQNSAED